MKILMINENYAGKGGAVRIFWQEVNELRNLGNEVFTFTIDKNETKKKNESYDFIYHESKIKTLNAYHRVFFDPFLIFNLKKIIDKIKPNIIHLHNIDKQILSILISMPKDIPVVKTVHDFNIICASGWGIVKKTGKPCETGDFYQCLKNGCIPFPKFMAFYPRKKIEKKLYKKVDLFICPSESFSEKLKLKGFNTNLLYNFSEDFKYNKTKKEYFLYVGELTKQKGVEYLIKAFDLLRKGGITEKLLIIGSGNEKKRLKKLVKDFKLNHEIDFLGQVDNNKLSNYYQQAKALILPSIWLENNPLVALEALSNSCPIIASNIGGLPEIVKNGQNGFLFTPRNPLELSEKIGELSKNYFLVKKFGENSKKIWKEKFNEKVHFLNLIIIYNNLIKSYDDSKRN